MKSYYVYIMTNWCNTVLYTGVTSDLEKRVYQHKHGYYKGFTKRYRIKKLVYFECCEDVYSAIEREKQLKAGSRQRKVNLVEKSNKDWRDLSDGWYDD